MHEITWDAGLKSDMLIKIIEMREQQRRSDSEEEFPIGPVKDV
jgi:hypothetical protein